MADNTDDDIFESSTNTQPENISDETIFSPEPDNLIPKQETENMETHAHHLHNAPGKEFKHYFFEFFMLFLAVFCGFLAENVREHYVEHQKEKEYMQSLIQDLNSDLKGINSSLELGTIVSEKLDSLVYVINEESPEKNCQTVYRLVQTAGRIVKVTFEDRTSSQLKNSGSMRLVRNSSLSDSIRNYWTQVKQDDEIGFHMIEAQGESSDVAVKIINNKYFEKRNPSNPFSLVSISSNARFINSDPKIMAEFSNRANSRLRILYIYLLNLRETKEMVLRLIPLIKKEYHLE
jgi:hypothetical protein